MKGIIGVCKNYFKKENIVRDGKNSIKITHPAKYQRKSKETAFFNTAIGNTFWLWDLLGKNEISLTISYLKKLDALFRQKKLNDTMLFLPVWTSRLK